MNGGREQGPTSRGPDGRRVRPATARRNVVIKPTFLKARGIGLLEIPRIKKRCTPRVVWKSAKKVFPFIQR